MSNHRPKRARPIQFVIWLNAEEKAELQRLAEIEREPASIVIRSLIREAARRRRAA